MYYRLQHRTPTPAITVLLTLAAVSSAEVRQLNYGRVGEADTTTSAGIDHPAAAILLRQQFDRTGIVYAFRACFRNLRPLRFQLWRPAANDSTSNSYRLLSEVSYRSASLSAELPRIETFYLASHVESNNRRQSQCLRVQRGDRLGVYTEYEHSSFSYVFSSTQTSVDAGTILAHIFPNATYPVIDADQSAVVFESTIFPYDIVAAAYFYYDDNITAADDTDVDCNTAAIIPGAEARPNSTVPPPQRGPIGSTGSSGPIGPTGNRGVDGRIGIVGFSGSSGIAGVIGQRGETGQTGSQGAYGLSGPAGLPGDTGHTGATGSLGNQGSTGRRGSTGYSGFVLYLNDSGSFNASFAQLTESDKVWKSKEFKTGSLIWMSILSFMILAYITVLLVLSILYCSKRNQSTEVDVYADKRAAPETGMEMKSGPNHDLTDVTAIDAERPDWMANLPEQSTVDYPNDSNTADVTRLDDVDGAPPAYS